MTFTSADICAFTGASYRQIDYWCRTGRLGQAAKVPHGSGRPRSFDLADVILARAYVLMTEVVPYNGVDASPARSELAAAVAEDPALNGWRLVAVAGKCEMTKRTAAPAALVVNLAVAAADVDEARKSGRAIPQKPPAGGHLARLLDAFPLLEEVADPSGCPPWPSGWPPAPPSARCRRRPAREPSPAPAELHHDGAGGPHRGRGPGPCPRPSQVHADQPFRVPSLGAGVQSSTVLLMSLLGELDRLDAAIFADTQWEPAEVYDHLEKLKRQPPRAVSRSTP